MPAVAVGVDRHGKFCACKKRWIAWELLSAIPAGQRTNWLCLALCQQAQREQFLLDLKTILQTELQSSSYPQTISQPQPAGSVDDDVLGFLRALQEEGEES